MKPGRARWVAVAVLAGATCAPMDEVSAAEAGSAAPAAATAPALPARPPLSIADAFRPPGFATMALSPDGRRLAAIATTPGRRAVLLIDPDNPASSKPLTPASLLDTPMAVRWLSKDLLAIGTLVATHVVDLDGQVLRSTPGFFYRALPPDAEGREQFLLAGRRVRHYIERFNARTGDSEVVNFPQPGGQVLRWVFDERGDARVVSTVSTAFWSDDTTVTHWHRRSAGDPWVALATHPWLEVPWQPVSLTRDGRHLLVSSTQGRDTAGIFRYDLDTRQLGELMVGHPTEDLGVAEREDDSDDYRRVVTLGMQPRTHWFDARWAGLQQAVDAALPERINDLRGDPQGRVLVASRSDVEPLTWHLLDTRAMSLRTIAPSRAHIDPARMAPMRSVSYPSVDGLAIPAYLTLPRGASGPVPAVVVVHGGPVVRDHWGWDPVVQMLASRGYAVLQPQFRGSAGFGRRFEEAGYGQWGLAMQDDVTAGARWLVSQGIAAPDRLCVYGASYGGYAAMWAMASTPDLFRCGISYVGVSDLMLMFKDGSDVGQHATGRLQQRKIIGDPKTRAQHFDEVSPLKRAGDFRGPVLIGHGERDRRVPVEHGRRLAEALKERGKAVEWISFREEGHGLVRPANQQRFYGAMFELLDRSIGTAAKPAEAAASSARVPSAAAPETR